jgi:hypothetical protein
MHRCSCFQTSGGVESTATADPDLLFCEEEDRVRLFATLILAALGVASQAAPQRDTLRSDEPKGTAIVRGRVVAADNGSPMRRANVSLQPAPPPVQVGASASAGAPPQATAVVQPSPAIPPGRVRQAVTDADGAFEFRDVIPGSYRIYANPGVYLGQYTSLAYGAKASAGPLGSDPGLTIQVTDRQMVDKVVIALPRGAVITGRVMDEDGTPLSRVQVYAIAFPSGSPRGLRVGSGSQTDDLGQFRLYGLQSGEFVVAAEARGNTFVPPNGPQEPDGDQTGFMTTYFPRVTDESAAQRLRARAGSETSGVDIRLGTGRLFRVSGTVADSQGRPVSRTKRTGVDADGNYRVSGLMPGRYYIAAIPRERLTFPVGSVDVAYFEQLSKDASTVVVGDNEQRRVDLSVLQVVDR